MRKLLIIFLLFALKSNSQVYQSMTQYGYDAKRMNFDSTLQIPTVCGVPTLKSVVGIKKAAIAFDSCNKRFYYYNPKSLAWDTIQGGAGGGGSTDTTSLSNRINQRVKYTDTSAMLLPYVNLANYGLTKSGQILSVDTSKISTLYQTNIKLNISDTANKWVGSVTGLNDSTIRVVKDGTTTDIIIKPTTTVTSATRLITTVYNKTGATITKGSVVYIDGAHSSVLPSIALSKANTEATSANTYGLVETDITNNSQGTVIQNGTITNLNLPTSSYTDGQTLYLSPTIAGGYTTTKPLAPYHYVAIGTITRAHPNFGTIQVAIRNGFQLDEMSDVQIAAVPIDSTILQFSRVDSLWHAVNPTVAMGNRFVKTSDSSAMLNSYLKTAIANATYTKQIDTIPMFVFGAGSGASGDTLAFSTSAIYGSFYNDFSDTIVLTSFRIGLQGTSPSINATIYFNDSLAVTAGATKIVNAGTTATNIYTGTNVTSLDNTKIPPGNWIWVQTGTVTTKPTYFALTLFGYKSRR
jgi:hypothetical protein